MITFQWRILFIRSSLLTLQHPHILFKAGASTHKQEMREREGPGTRPRVSCSIVTKFQSLLSHHCRYHQDLRRALSFFTATESCKSSTEKIEKTAHQSGNNGGVLLAILDTDIPETTCQSTKSSPFSKLHPSKSTAGVWRDAVGNYSSPPQVNDSTCNKHNGPLDAKTRMQSFLCLSLSRIYDPPAILSHY